MRAIISATVILVSAASMAAEPKLIASMKILRGPLTVGSKPLVLLTIQNWDKQRIFIDQSQFTTRCDVAYGSDLGVPVGVPGQKIWLATDGAVLKRRWSENSILVLDPGKSFVRVVQINELEKPGDARILVTAFFPSSVVETIDEINWPSYSAPTAVIRVPILPKNPE